MNTEYTAGWIALATLSEGLQGTSLALVVMDQDQLAIVLLQELAEEVWGKHCLNTLYAAQRNANTAYGVA